MALIVARNKDIHWVSIGGIYFNEKIESVNYKKTYARIEEISGTKSLVKIVVGFYNEGADGSLVDRMSSSFVPDLCGPNFIKQGYEYLKTLPEFAGAVDC